MRIVFPQDDGIFQQDNARCHIAASVRAWFEEHQDEFTVLPWPENSPDLNPIEHLTSVDGISRHYRKSNRESNITSITQWQRTSDEGLHDIESQIENILRASSYSDDAKAKLHWCAKIKDEVEELAYQLNEEAERTERPIRRLSKVMYGSTCADMQVDVMGECLNSIKHVVGTTSGCIGKLEESCSVTSVAAEFGIAHSIVSRHWRQFQTTGTAIRGFSSGRPRGTTPADDRYIVLQAKRNRRQTAGEIARHTTQATGRPISRFTVARRLHGGGLFARRPVRCVPLTPAHRRRHSHRNWRDNEWGRVLFTDESRFSLSRDSHRLLIWRERGSRNHPSNIIERDRYGGRGVLVWGGIMLGSRTDLHIFDAGSVNGTRYCNKILLPYVRLFRGTMDWPARSPDLNPIEHVWDFLGRRLAARTLPPVTIRELRLALQDEWAAMPQQLIDTLILSMGRRCETCLAVRGDHIPY
ncbi:transposable element Tcb2 transposase [Trichonephila clavipes]|uniref:Transposable element Tcb2 transposase n=2 Tax=Trichonephila clavipes TaxID=2585209 RepID=A0A8X6VIU6_TRICX|nr:transposable element Tcb2 transposase [Trichonephila clavipes]